MASSSMARSRTVRAIGPSAPITVGQLPKTPQRLTKPAVARIPAIEFQVDGLRMDARPSWPMPAVAKFAETLAAEPPEEPPTVRSSAYGLRVDPKREP